MNFWETITGNDLTREWKAFEARAQALPADYQAAWEQIKGNLFPYGTSAVASCCRSSMPPWGCSKKPRWTD